MTDKHYVSLTTKEQRLLSRVAILSYIQQSYGAKAIEAERKIISPATEPQ